MHAKPVIGINTDYRPARKEIGAHSYCHAGYYDRVLTAGGVALLIPSLTTEKDLNRVLDLLDGLILVGGNDLDPRRLGLLPHPAVRVIAPRREDSDRLLCRLAMQRKMPLLAICLGMQTLNVVAGGTLWQHIPEDLPRALPHTDPLGGPHRHALVVTRGTRAEAIYGEGEIRVNSSHHQAIRKIAAGFRVSATAPDGVIEAIESVDDDWYCLGVQWHPESETASALDAQVFENFISACSGKPSGSRSTCKPSNGHATKAGNGRANEQAAATTGERPAPPGNGRRKSRVLARSSK